MRIMEGGSLFSRGLEGGRVESRSSLSPSCCRPGGVAVDSAGVGVFDVSVDAFGAVPATICAQRASTSMVTGPVAAAAFFSSLLLRCQEGFKEILSRERNNKIENRWTHSWALILLVFTKPPSPPSSSSSPSCTPSSS